jgi:hypothetical protein
LSSPALSASAKLAWKIAANEANHFGSPSLEVEHLLLGLCSFGKALDSGIEGSLSSAEDSVEIRSVWDTILNAFGSAQFDPMTVRRKLRSVIGPATARFPGRGRLEPDRRSQGFPLTGSSSHRTSRSTALSESFRNPRTATEIGWNRFSYR